MMFRAKLTTLLLPLFATACVSSGRYDAAVQSSTQLRSALAATKAEYTKTKRSLDAANREAERVRDELARLDSKAYDLVVEKGSLANQLGDTRKRLDEMKRAQAAADARAAQYRDLAARLQKMVDAGDLRVVLRDGRMVLQLPNDVLFASGQTDIKPKGQEALKRIAAVLATLQGRHFQVAGHTDDVPIALSRFPSNWELSTARGVEVVRLLIASGVRPEVLAAAGYGEFDPVAPNTDASGRARNRRIEITLQPNVDELVRANDVK